MVDLNISCASISVRRPFSAPQSAPSFPYNQLKASIMKTLDNYATRQLEPLTQGRGPDTARRSSLRLSRMSSSYNVKLKRKHGAYATSLLGVSS